MKSILILCAAWMAISAQITVAVAPYDTHITTAGRQRSWSGVQQTHVPVLVLTTLRCDECVMTCDQYRMMTMQMAAGENTLHVCCALPPPCPLVCCSLTSPSLCSVLSLFRLL